MDRDEIAATLSLLGWRATKDDVIHDRESDVAYNMECDHLMLYCNQEAQVIIKASSSIMRTISRSEIPMHEMPDAVWRNFVTYLIDECVLPKEVLGK